MEGMALVLRSAVSVAAAGVGGLALAVRPTVSIAAATVSAVAATVSTAEIQRRTRRVIATSLIRCVPASGITGSSKPRWRRMGVASPGGKKPARGPGRLTLADRKEGATDRSGARPRRLVNAVEDDARQGRVGVGVGHASLGGDGQADHQRGGGDGQHCRDPKAYAPGHRDLLLLDASRGLRITGGSKPRPRRMVPHRRAAIRPTAGRSADG